MGDSNDLGARHLAWTFSAEANISSDPYPSYVGMVIFSFFQEWHCPFEKTVLEVSCFLVGPKTGFSGRWPTDSSCTELAGV